MSPVSRGLPVKFAVQDACTARFFYLNQIKPVVEALLPSATSVVKFHKICRKVLYCQLLCLSLCCGNTTKILSINIVIAMNTIVTDGTRTVTFDLPLEEVEKRITTFTETTAGEGKAFLSKSVKTDEEELTLANEIKHSLSKCENLVKFTEELISEGKDKFSEIVPSKDFNTGDFIETLAKNIAKLHRHNLANSSDYVQAILTLADVSEDALCAFIMEILRKGAVLMIFGHASDSIKELFGL